MSYKFIPSPRELKKISFVTEHEEVLEYIQEKVVPCLPALKHNHQIIIKFEGTALANNAVLINNMVAILNDRGYDVKAYDNYAYISESLRNDEYGKFLFGYAGLLGVSFLNSFNYFQTMEALDRPQPGILLPMGAVFSVVCTGYMIFSVFSCIMAKISRS